MTSYYQGVTMTREDLLKTLEDLRDQEFQDFKWYLQQPEVLTGHQTIKASKLEKAERRDTVDLMVQTCKLRGALMVTRKVLGRINRNDLVQSLSDTNSEPRGQSHSYISTLSLHIHGIHYAKHLSY